MTQDVNAIAAAANAAMRDLYGERDRVVGGFDELTTRVRIYLNIDRRTDELHGTRSNYPRRPSVIDRRSSIRHRQRSVGAIKLYN